MTSIPAAKGIHFDASKLRTRFGPSFSTSTNFLILLRLLDLKGSFSFDVGRQSETGPLVMIGIKLGTITAQV
jgi:hypothetical protein